GGGGLRPAVGGGDLLQRPARAAGSHDGLLWLCGCLPPGAVDEEGGGGAGVLPRPHCGQLPHAGRRVEPFLRLHRRPRRARPRLDRVRLVLEHPDPHPVSAGPAGVLGGAWAFLRRKLKRIAESLTAAMWWMVDAVMLAPFVC